MSKPIIMSKEYWETSQLSVARYYGRVNLNGEEYYIVNRHGITLMELSDPGSRHYVKQGMAIPEGEPADLVMKQWIPVYKRLGREKTFDLVRNNVPLKEARRIKKNDGKTNEQRDDILF